MEIFLIMGGTWLLYYIYQHNRKTQKDYVDNKNVELHEIIIKEVREMISEEVRKVLEEQRTNSS